MSFVFQIIGQHAFALVSELSDDQELKFFTQLFEYESQLLQTEYSLTGSLLESKHDGGYVVGPLGHPMLPYHVTTFTEGPWGSTEDILKAFSRMRRDFIMKDTHLWKKWRHHYRLLNRDFDGDPPLAFFQTFYTLLAEAIEKLKFADETPCVLYNPDLTDILVSYEDPSHIVGIVDWEGTCLLPMWYDGVLFNPRMFRGFLRGESMIEKWAEFRHDMLKAHGVPLLDHLKEGETWRVRRSLMWWFLHDFIDTASPQVVADEFMEIWKSMSWEATTQALFEPVVDYLKQSALCE
ncbi:MAG TPA: hypothetical protein VGO47_00490 [Chlamydiales bacterium]|nr:hypothetical protein [Chlamydiales bacterium]